MVDIPYKALNILLEATEACNLRCKYCYHADDGYMATRMSEDTFKKICELTFPYYEQIQFLWHGGEPLCVGLEFHEKIFSIQKEYINRYPTVKVINAIQSNGTLIDKGIAEFLVNNDFTVGISFDGTSNEKIRGKTEAVLKGIKLLKEVGIKNLGVLTVVSGININHLEEEYKLMKELNISTDYNSLVLTGGAEHFLDVQLELTNFCKNMKHFFDIWFYDTECNIVINPFHSYVKDMMLNTASVCWRTSCLGRWINVKPDGTVYPCSREYPSEYSYGKIQEIGSINELFSSKGFKKLLAESIKRREKCEQECQWYYYCQGGCSCTALTESGIENNGGFSCESFKKIFGYCYSQVEYALNKGADYIKNNVNPMIREVILQNI